MKNDSAIQSSTYKLKAEPVVKHALYFTIAGAPVEALFLNCKEMNNFEWISALMTSYSRQIKMGATPLEVAEQMLEVFAPGGSYIRQGSNEKVQSIVHHLGLILLEHIREKDDGDM